MRPGPKDVMKIWEWTVDDVTRLSSVLCIDKRPGRGGHGPSNAIGIFLASLMDIWGSIILNKFGEKNNSRINTAEILKMLNKKYPELYVWGNRSEGDIADNIRNNLVHNYGLRYIFSEDRYEWLNIDCNSVGPIINVQDNERLHIERLHIDCWRLSKHLLEIIENWLKINNYI